MCSSSPSCVPSGPTRASGPLAGALILRKQNQVSRKCRVEFVVDEANVCTYVLEENRASRSTWLWACISCVHCMSVRQSRPVIGRHINSLTLLSVSFSIEQAPMFVQWGSISLLLVILVPVINVSRIIASLIKSRLSFDGVCSLIIVFNFVYFRWFQTS